MTRHDSRIQVYWSVLISHLPWSGVKDTLLGRQTHGAWWQMATSWNNFILPMPPSIGLLRRTWLCLFYDCFWPGKLSGKGGVIVHKGSWPGVTWSPAITLDIAHEKRSPITGQRMAFWRGMTVSRRRHLPALLTMTWCGSTCLPTDHGIAPSSEPQVTRARWGRGGGGMGRRLLLQQPCLCSGKKRPHALLNL